MCSFGYAKCQEEMHALLSSGGSTHPDLQELVFCGGMRRGTLENFLFLLDQHMQRGKKRILRSMACTSDTEILRYYITAVVNESAIVHLKEHDRVDVFMAVLEGSDLGVEVALNFAKQYLEQILIKFTQEDIERMFIALSRKLISDPHQQTVLTRRFLVRVKTSCFRLMLLLSVSLMSKRCNMVTYLELSQIL